MGQAGIFIPFADLHGNPELKAVLAPYVAAQLGLLPQPDEPAPKPDEEGLAELSVRKAKLFLNNCGVKTVKVLAFVVEHDGELLASELHRHMRTKELRGVWTGLTRRVRNVTRDDEARLLHWFYKPTTDDWRIIMAARTVASFKVALRERA